MGLLINAWSWLVPRRRRIVVALVILVLIAPQPAAGQFGFLFGLTNLVNSGLGALHDVMRSVNNTLRTVIGPLLEAIYSVLFAAQEILRRIFDFQRTVVYPERAIASARAVIGQVRGIYNSIRGIWDAAVRSATLPNPRRLEAAILSRDPRQIASVEASFSAVYTPLPPDIEAHPWQRNLIDSADAAAQAAMKRSIAIDAIADQELAAADRLMAALEEAAPGTAGMIGAQAGAWLVRSHAYTQQATAELMRIRSIELAVESARLKEAARYLRETRGRLSDLNR